MFRATIFLSAFLLFLVQPLLAKQILPWFGGSAAVWTTCMLFFQTLLLAGYAYAHWLAARPSPRRQWRVHAVLVAASSVALFAGAAFAGPPASAGVPVVRIIALLAGLVGLPYFVLSTTGPLLQAWHARLWPAGATYRLYALSNLGSFLGLLSFPFALEPLLPRRAIWEIWQTLYVVCAIAIAFVAHRVAATAADVAAREVGDGGVGAAAAASPEPAPSAARQGYWLLLAATTSVLLVAGTAHLTQDVAAIPFLWVLPLAAYLLAFVIAFDREQWYRPALFVPAALVMTVLLAIALTDGIDATLPRTIADFVRHPLGPGFWSSSELMDAVKAIPLFVGGIFVLSWFCNGELVRSKPAPRYLTRYYLVIAAGGALGALIVAVAGPLLLPGYYELPAALLVVALLGVARARGDWRVVALAPTLVVAVFAARYGTSLHSATVTVLRDFYGLYAVEQYGRPGADNFERRLMSGTVLHGDQRLAPARRRVPTEYYTPSSGIGRALGLLSTSNLRIGLIGLGTGTLAAYGRPGDSYHFYEINPDVLELARDWFTYLGDSAADISIALGDARLALSRQGPQRLDVLVVDAFTSDAIPVHLLTREAMREYARHVAPDRLIAFHISNRELELMPVVQDLAESIGRRAVLVSDAPKAPTLASDWMLVTNSPALLGPLRSGPGASVLDAETGLRPWTDDYSSLLQVWKPFRRLTGRPQY